MKLSLWTILLEQMPFGPLLAAFRCTNWQIISLTAVVFIVEFFLLKNHFSALMITWVSGEEQREGHKHLGLYIQPCKTGVVPKARCKCFYSEVRWGRWCFKSRLNFLLIYFKHSNTHLESWIISVWLGMLMMYSHFFRIESWSCHLWHICHWGIHCFTPRGVLIVKPLLTSSSM